MKKSVVAMLIALLLTATSFGQTALVVPLSTDDAARARQVHQSMLDAEKRWEDFQHDIKLKYLIVDKADSDAGDAAWYPPEQVWNNGLTTLTTTYLGSGSFLVAGPGGAYFSSEDRCDPKRVAEHEAWQAEQDRLARERLAKARRYRKGWNEPSCSNCDPIPFEFSADFKFIVPAKAPEKPNYSPNQ